MFYKVLISITAFFLFSFSNTHAQSDQSYDDFTVLVEGLGCPFCAYGLEKKFKELKGLKKPAIDMETGRFTFRFPSAEALSIERVEQQVDAAGYTAVRVQIDRANGQREDSKPVATTSAASSAVKTATLTVAGNCGMCKARIEKAAHSVAGVQKATWEAEEQQLSVRFDPSRTSTRSIAQRIADRGHDTRSAKAAKKTYEALPACCLYKRLK